MAYFSYRQYYPPLESEYSHRPYSPRIKREDEEGLPTHAHTTSTSAYPFAGASAPSQSHGSNVYGHTGDEEYELEGTVLRPHPGSLEEIWRKDAHGEPVQERSGDIERKEASPTEYAVPTPPNVGTSSPRMQTPAHVYQRSPETA